jgi:hypothetical protein
MLGEALAFPRQVAATGRHKRQVTSAEGVHAEVAAWEDGPNRPAF